MGAKLQWEYSLGRFEGKYAVLCIQKTLFSPKFRSPLKLWAQFVSFWQCLQARLLGNSYWFSLKIVSFHVTFVLCCCSPAEKHAHWSSHHSHTSCGRTGKRQLLQGYSTTKHFYTMFSSANTKEFLFTCQHDYSVQCFLLNVDRWSYFPTWSCGKSWDVGQRRPTILPGLPHGFGPWSGQSVSPSPLLKNKQGVWVSKEGKEKASEKRGRTECWVGKSIKGAGKETNWMCKLKRERESKKGERQKKKGV